MKIYFSGSIAGGRKFLSTYKKIVQHLKSENHDVLTEHIVYDDIIDFEEKYSATEIYRRDKEFLYECDLVIAEISNPSLGVGYEIAYAEMIEKPVLCIYHKDINVSRMVIGIDSPHVTIEYYHDDVSMIKIIDKFLDK